jgi:hypothetical protein
MRRSRSIAFLLYVLYAVLTPAGAQDKRLTMSGIVTDSRSHRPVEGATVTVVGNKANPDTTDSDGNFILTFSASTREGEVVLIRVEKIGYRVYEVKKPVSPSMPLHLLIDRIAEPRRSQVPPSHEPIADSSRPRESEKGTGPESSLAKEAISLSDDVLEFLARRREDSPPLDGPHSNPQTPSDSNTREEIAFKYRNDTVKRFKDEYAPHCLHIVDQFELLRIDVSILRTTCENPDETGIKTVPSLLREAAKLILSPSQPSRNAPSEQPKPTAAIKPLRDPLEIVAFRSDYGISIANNGPIRVYVINLFLHSKYESKSFALGLDIGPGKVAQQLIHEEGILHVRSSRKLGATWDEHVQMARERYNSCGMQFGYFAPTDVSFRQIKQLYVNQNLVLGYDDISGIFFFRFEGGNKTQEQTVPIEQTIWVNNDTCPRDAIITPHPEP